MSARCPNLFGRPAALLRSLSPVPISPNTVCVSASACDPWGEAPGAKGADTRKKLLTRSLRRSERSFVECSAVATGGRATAFLRVVARRCEAARGVGRPCLASVSRFGCDGFISQALGIDRAFAAGAFAIGELLASPIDLPQFRFLRQPRAEGMPLVQCAVPFGLRPRGSMLAVLIIWVD